MYIIFSFASLVLINNKFGFIPILLLLILSIKDSKKEDIAIALLLVGKHFFGFLSVEFQIPIPLGVISGIIAIMFLHSKIPIQTLFKHGNILITLMFSFLFFVFFYFLGPNDSISFQKLFDIIYNAIIYLIAFYYLILLKSVNIRNSAFLILSIMLMYTHICVVKLLQENILFLWMFGSLRTAFMMFPWLERPNYSYQVLGNALVLSVLFTMIRTVDKKLTKNDLLDMIALIVPALLIIFISGSRQSILLLLISLSSIILTKPQYMKRYVIMGISTLLLIIVSLSHSLGTDNQLLNEVSEAESITDAMNRGTEYVYTENILKTKPMLGVGLGGYRIMSSNIHGKIQSRYAHNLFLELLTETGIIGTFVFLSIWIVSIISTKKKMPFLSIFRTRAKSNFVVLPILIYFFLRSMVSSNLTYSIGIFILILLMYEFNFEIKTNNKDTTVPPPPNL